MPLSLTTRIFRRIRKKSRDIYLGIQFSWPLWFYLHNRQARKEWVRRKPRSLDGVQLRILEGLTKDGIAIMHMTDFFPESLWHELRTYAQSVWLSPKAQAEHRRLGEQEETYWRRREMQQFMLGAPREYPPLNLASPVMRLMLDERVLAVGAAYLELAPRLRDFNIGASVPTHPMWHRTCSQLWHRDEGDKRFFKLFVYLSDVETEEDGAIVYVRQSHYGAPLGHLFPNKPWGGYWLPPGVVEKAIPKENVQICTGKAGTLIFADTSALHNNGRTLTRPRLCFLATYNSLMSRRYKNYSVPHKLEGLSPLAEYAVIPDK